MNIFQVDAFNSEIFKGNPAAVIPLDIWISEKLMQQIAEENNLSETVFFVENNSQFEIKWFTPLCEVDLCGHATLAAAHIIFSELNYKRKTIEFNSKSGLLKVTKNKDWYTLNFPAVEIEKIAVSTVLKEALNVPISEVFKCDLKLVVLLESEKLLTSIQPNFNLLSQLNETDIIITSIGNNSDFVSRFFAPKIGINEDPVTGSAHSLLIPYWSKKLNKTKLNALQLSKRVGILKCNYLNERVEMSGQAITYLKGKLTI